MNKLVILGAGQQGKVCKRLAEENGINVYGFVDDFKTGCFEGKPVFGRIEDIDGYKQCKYIVAFGSIQPRIKYINELAKLKLETINLIDKTAVIEHGAYIGNGNYIGKFAVIYGTASIGDNNIINGKAVCTTDVIIGNNNNISLGCNICGGTKIGNNCYVGCQASIVSGVTIEDGATIGAGSVVLRDVANGQFVAGVPAIRKERSR